MSATSRSEIAPPAPPATPPSSTPTPTPRANPRPGGKPGWMRHPLFRLFSSVRLAVVLISVLIVASIAGTLYETSFDARVARAYIYNAWWFNLWLTVLCLNLACAAFSRWPWKRHHTGFLLTHLGIIVLLIGAMIGRRWGIEGTMTLFKGQPPDNKLEIVDENVLRVEDGSNGRGEVRQFPVEIIGRRPTPAKPWVLGQTAGGWDLALVDYAPALEAAFEPQAVPQSVPGATGPAVHLRLVSKRLKQSIDQWLLAGDAEHNTIDLGLAAVTLSAGTAADATPPPRILDVHTMPPATHDPVDEQIFALALHPDEGKHLPVSGSAPSGVGVRLRMEGDKPTVLLDWQGATWNLDADTDLEREDTLGDSGLRVVILKYWPDVVVDKDDQITNASNQPRNPAVLVRVHGKPAASGETAAAPDTAAAPAAPAPGTAPNIGTSANNNAAVYCDAAGKLTFTLRSSALPEPKRGDLALNQPINTGWADWQIEAVQVMQNAAAHVEFRPAKEAPATTDDKSATSGDPNLVGSGGGAPGGPAGNNMADPGNNRPGVRVRLSRSGSTPVEQWAPVGWELTLPTAPGPTRLAYGPRIEALPIGVQLDGFEVTFNEGTENPASFKSNLRVTDVEGTVGTGSCSMNHPFNFPGSWVNTFSGQTFKMSQASWNPQDRTQSIVQILRDPGWLLKWIGSLFICAGIFTLFYLRPPQRLGPGVASKPAKG